MQKSLAPTPQEREILKNYEPTLQTKNFLKKRHEFRRYVCQIAQELPVRYALIVSEELENFLDIGFSRSTNAYKAVKYANQIIETFIQYANETVENIDFINPEPLIITHIAHMCKLVEDMFRIIIDEYHPHEKSRKLPKASLALDNNMNMLKQLRRGEKIVVSENKPNKLGCSIC
jgi:hypothetical protein